MTCRSEAEITPANDDEHAEVCDRCGKWLNRRSNEDIWLSKVSVVLCAKCHGEHKGIEVYW